MLRNLKKTEFYLNFKVMKYKALPLTIVIHEIKADNNWLQVGNKHDNKSNSWPFSFVEP